MERAAGKQRNRAEEEKGTRTCCLTVVRSFPNSSCTMHTRAPSGKSSSANLDILRLTYPPRGLACLPSTGTFGQHANPQIIHILDSNIHRLPSVLCSLAFRAQRLPNAMNAVRRAPTLITCSSPVTKSKSPVQQCKSIQFQ
jgi:hypothetical protein